MPSNVKYGSTIYLKHVKTGLLLRSFPRAYCHPGTSGQQMVVASLEKSEETRWLVKGAHRLGQEYAIGEEVVHEHRIRLEHCSTNRNLHSHGDRLSPVTKQQEVTCLGINGTGDDNDDWIVTIPGGGAWCFDQNVRLIHVNTNRPLHSHNNQSHPVYTNGEQEVTCFPVAVADWDDNDLWAVTSLDQPPLNERIKIPSDSRTSALNALNIAGSIASITGWTLLTLSKTLQATTFIDLLSYLISSALLLGLFMIFLSIVWNFHIQMTANPRPFLWRSGFWLVSSAVVLFVFIVLWRLVTFMSDAWMSPTFKWAFTGGY